MEPICPRPVLPDEYEQLDRFLSEIFLHGSSQGYCREYPQMFALKNLDNLLVISDNDQIVAHAGLVVRTMIAGNLRLEVGIIGSVATSPLYRNRGFSAAIIRSLLGRATGKSLSLVLLWSDLDSFYTKLGFFRGGTENLFRISLPDYHKPPSAVDFDRSDLPIGELQTLYRRHPGRVDRSDEEFRRLISIPNCHCSVSTNEATIDAYLVLDKGTDLNDHIHEWAGAPESVVEISRQLAFRRQKDLYLHSPKYTTEANKVFQQAFGPAIQGSLAHFSLVDTKSLARSLASGWKEKHSLITEGKSYRVVCENTEICLENDQELFNYLFNDWNGPGNRAFDLPYPLYIWGLDSA